jgi:N-acetyl-anhydromuramyl-L-alanine amidase AmpD
MPDAEAIPTAAFGYGGATGMMQPIAVMSHIMQGYQRTMIAWAKERPYVTPKSSHFTIGRDGRIAQHVSIFDPCWAAGYVNRPTWSLYRPLSNPNNYLIQIEHEGFSVPPGYGFDYVYDDARSWPAPMVEASIKVHRWAMAEAGIVPSRDTVIGHFMTDGVNRINDPGAAWPRDAVVAALTGQQADASPRLSLDAAIRAIVDCYVPIFDSTIKARLLELPRDGSEDVYQLRIERKG